MGPRRRNVLGAAVVALVLATAGCRSGGVEGEATPTTVAPGTTTVPTPPPTTLTDEEAVLAAYQGYWDTWLVANDPPDPDHPDLSRYATGAALQKAQEAIASHRLLQQSVRLPSPSRSGHVARVVEILGEKAVLEDCSVDDSLLVDMPSGRVMNDAIGTLQLDVRLVRRSTGWLVVGVDEKARWDGVAGCAA